jgi:uncharacterized membrane protein
MITEEEKNFIHYWEQNRSRQKKIFRQFLLGIPIGLAFVIPILINFFSGWYKRADMIVNTKDFDPLVLIIAMLLITGFIAIFSKRHQWDMNEQRYRELLAKENENAPGE